MEFIRTDTFLIILSVALISIFILYIVNIIKLNKIKREYENFMKKLGNGRDIEELLEGHIDRINKVISKNDELEKFCTKLDSDIKSCIQRVRYI